MMNPYSGFDALDACEYDEIMEALAIADLEEKVSEQQKLDYLNKLEKDGEGR